VAAIEKKISENGENWRRKYVSAWLKAASGEIMAAIGENGVTRRRVAKKATRGRKAVKAKVASKLKLSK